MTLAAEIVTIEFDDETVWAPVDRNMFWDETTTWSPRTVREWFATTGPTPRGPGKLLGPQGPSALSSALGGPVIRYIVRGGLLLPKWVAFSVLDHDALAARGAPANCRFESRDGAVFMLFDEPEPLNLPHRVGLVRCYGEDVHWWMHGHPSTPEPERWLEPANGADGYV